MRRACARAARVFLAAARITFPKYSSASAGRISHSGLPNHARTCSRFDTSALIVLSDRPAAARASTNPASTSVSNAAATASGPSGTRASRTSRTTASPIPPPSRPSLTSPEHQQER